VGGILGSVFGLVHLVSSGNNSERWSRPNGWEEKSKEGRKNKKKLKKEIEEGEGCGELEVFEGSRNFSKRRTRQKEAAMTRHQDLSLPPFQKEHSRTFMMSRVSFRIQASNKHNKHKQNFVTPPSPLLHGHL